MDGALLFHKPILWTSHDAVDFFRRLTGQKKIGHTGTLDPLATGLLVMLLGRATKASDRFSSFDKDYAGTLLLGWTTDTQDLEGRILERRPAEGVGAERVRGAFERCLGVQEQIAPLYSAVKRGGQKSCDRARRGLAVAPVSRRIEVRAFELTAFDFPEASFFLSCGKGTYVRALCDRVGGDLGCGAVLSSLLRLRVGPYHVRDAMREHEARACTPADLERRLRHENL